MDYFPTRGRDFIRDLDDCETEEQAVRFLLNLINATIYSSGEDYGRSVRDFYAQLEALGQLVGAGDIDEVSLFLRRHCRPL